VFPDLNVGRIAADLELERHAAERAARNEPLTNSTGLDEIELSVIERVESEKKSAHGTLLDELEVYGERLGEGVALLEIGVGMHPA